MLVDPFPLPQLGQQQGSMHPGYVPGRIYYGCYAGGPSALLIAANVAHFNPIIVSSNHLFTGLAIEVQAIGTANNARLALYNSLNGLPSTVVIGAGNSTIIPGVNPMQTTGMKITNALAISLTPGLYFGAYVADGSVTIQGTSSGQIGYETQMGTTTLFSNPDGELSATQAFASLFPNPAFTGTMGPPVYTAGGVGFVGLVA